MRIVDFRFNAWGGEVDGLYNNYKDDDLLCGRLCKLFDKERYYLDDFVLLPFLVFLTIKFIPCDILEKYREESKNLWIDEKPKKWYFAVPIIFIWLIIIFIVYSENLVFLSCIWRHYLHKQVILTT